MYCTAESPRGIHVVYTKDISSGTTSSEVQVGSLSRALKRETDLKFPRAEPLETEVSYRTENLPFDLMILYIYISSFFLSFFLFNL